MGMYLIKVKFHLVAFFKIIIYKVLFGNSFIIGKKSTFRKNFSLYLQGGNIKIGNKCFFNNSCSINSLGNIIIEDGCIFGENVKLYDHNHRFANVGVSIKEQGFSVGNIFIGKDCWIGSNVTILKGSKIGDNCVIGAGCVISQEIPPCSVVTAGRKLNIEKIIKA